MKQLNLPVTYKDGQVFATEPLQDWLLLVQAVKHNSTILLKIGDDSVYFSAYQLGQSNEEIMRQLVRYAPMFNIWTSFSMDIQRN